MLAKRYLTRLRTTRHRPFWRLLAGVLIMGAALLPAAAHALENSLLNAASQGDVAAVRQALTSGAPINARDANGATALLLATYRNHVDVARVLIAAGADVNAQDHLQNSAYLYAGARGLNEILRLTLENGANLHSTNRYGGTALIPAAERGYVETVRLLIAAGTDINHLNRLHWTALLEAIILGSGGQAHTTIVHDLIQAGADVHIADAEGVTPLQHARRRGYKAIEDLLVQAGATH